MDEEYEQIRAITDPVELAVACQEKITEAEQVQREYAPLLREAIAQLRAGVTGEKYSHQRVADLLGVSRGRAQDIANGRRGGGQQ